MISRRDFLKATLAAAGLTIAGAATPFGYKIVNASNGASGEAGLKPTVFYEVTPDNLVTVYVPNTEMGQGVRTALSMIVADELEADWSQIRPVQAPVGDGFKSPVFGAQIVVGSSSVRGFYAPLRAAGAAGRMMLVRAAAETWKVPEAECEALKGVVSHKKSGKKLTYGELCRKAAALPVPKDVVLKKESDFRYMGKPMARVDIPEKVAGTGIFGMDVNVPDMLCAALARPPAYDAKPIGFDAKAAEAVKGVEKVVPMPRGIAVVAQTLHAAWKGREALHAKWDQGSHPEMTTESVEKHYREGLDKPGAVAVKTGDTKKALDEAQKKVEAVYYVPFVAHATMEPMNCTAYVQKDRCDVWVPTQAQTLTQVVASKITGLSPDKVFVHTTLVGCGLGRRARPEFVEEAVVASKATGKPVKVVWSREEDMKYDYFRAATCQRLTAGLDGQGKVMGWSQKVSCTSILRFANPAAIKDGVDIYSLWGIYDYEKTPVFNHTTYEIPNWYLEQYLSELPIPAAPWRSVQNAPNAFIMESFMDELARAATRDPVAFRLDLLKNNMRASRVLTTVAEKGGWGKSVPQGKGRGIAQHSCFGSYVAMVADVSVAKDGKIKVDKVVAAVDCGPVVNPAPLVVQIESGIIIGLSTVLKEQIKFAEGGVKSANFDDYPILRMSEAPEIEVHIIKSTEKIGGIGEVGVPPLAPAVANAVFNATGARVRRLPMDSATVAEAMKHKAT